MQTIVVSNRKGGSAKTTTAVSVAMELAKTYRVLLIDFDTQGHASIGVGAKAQESAGVHAIFEGVPLSHTFLPTICENLTLAPAQTLFELYEESSLRGILAKRFFDEKIEDFFDFCIIDTAPTFDITLKNALEVANAVVIPFVPHQLGVVAVSQMMRAIYQIGEECDNELTAIMLLPVMYNPHIREHVDNVEKVASLFGKEKLCQAIGSDTKLTGMFNEVSQFFTDEKRTKGRRDYLVFTQALLQTLGR